MASVVVSPLAFCAISLHATRHKNCTAHGLIIGTREDATFRVENAIPICHEGPTLPLVETALGLLANQNILGWYTAPMLLDDTFPSPVAMKMVECLGTGSNDPLLLVVQNQALATCLQDKAAPAGEALKAFGKQNNNQYKKPLNIIVEDSNKATKVILEALQQSYQLDDLEDHLERPESSSFPDRELIKLVSKTRG
jgi:hypothetical protein